MQWNQFSLSPASSAWRLGPTSTGSTTAHRPASGSAGDVAVVIHDTDADASVASASTHPAPFESRSSDSRSGRVRLSRVSALHAFFLAFGECLARRCGIRMPLSVCSVNASQKEVLASNPTSRGSLMVPTTASSKRPYSACQSRHQFSEHSMQECRRTKPLGSM